MRYVSWLITLPLTAFAVLFALLNRKSAAVTFSPFHDPVDMPLYMLCLGLMGFGFLAGALFVWVHSSKIRWARYQEARRAERLEKELQRQREEIKILKEKDMPATGALGAPRKTVPKAIGFRGF